jgi:hypothetical protein
MYPIMTVSVMIQMSSITPAASDAVHDSDSIERIYGVRPPPRRPPDKPDDYEQRE